jgi:ABC-type dipeptide/oligopeptide/nickel transport system ATPase component
MTDFVRAHRRASAREATRLATEKLRLVGVSAPEQRLRAYPWELSGGLRQRVAIAMALLLDPDLIIADEPTTALDVSIQAQIVELLVDLKQRLGFSLIFIIHDLGVVSAVADRVLVMYAGRAVERGPVTETFARPLHPYTAALVALGHRPWRASGVGPSHDPGQPSGLRRQTAGWRLRPTLSAGAAGLLDEAAAPRGDAAGSRSGVPLPAAGRPCPTQRTTGD